MSACGIAPSDDDGNAASRKLAPAVNPLDGVKAGSIVQVESPKTIETITAGGPVFTMAIPNKEPRIYDSSESYMKGTVELREKVEKSAMAARTKMTKLRELKEANEEQTKKLEIHHMTALLSDYQLRLKRLGAQLGEGESDGEQ